MKNISLFLSLVSVFEVPTDFVAHKESYSVAFVGQGCRKLCLIPLQKRPTQMVVSLICYKMNWKIRIWI